MTDVDLNFLGRQMQRVLAELKIIRGSIGIIGSGQRRSEDDVRIIKNDLQGLRSDLQGLRGEIAGVRNDMRNGFETLDARLVDLIDVFLCEET